MQKNIIEMREEILSSIRQKTGIGDIHLDITQNGKARVFMNNGKKIKDFINQADALQWLIYTYNLKQLKKSFYTLYSVQSHDYSRGVDGNPKDSIIEQASQSLCEKISNFEHYTSEIYSSLQKDIDQFKYDENFTFMEMSQIYGSLINKLQRLMDETFSHKRYQVYQKYLERLKKRQNSY